MNNNTALWVVLVLLALYFLSKRNANGTNVPSGTSNSANGNNYTPSGNNSGGVAQDIQVIGNTTASLIDAFAKIFDDAKKSST